ncbi:RICIN domain-containing protein [Streptomyces sp. CA-294286]|uniref:RICIN domain-containing protein n=1 Tax=Streptomyces sp. CA-294286 TaxID=3240070 RepID=UPI003D9475E9
MTAHQDAGAPAPPPGTYLLRNVGSGLLLEARGGTRVQQGRDSGAAGQRWLLSPVHEGSGLHHVVNGATGKRLDVANASVENGARVQQWRANNFGAQEWIVERHPDAPGRVSLVSWISGLLLEVAGGSAEDGADVQQWEDTDSPAQWWRLEPAAAE